jgi:hypothetical protein
MLQLNDSFPFVFYFPPVLFLIRPYERTIKVESNEVMTNILILTWAGVWFIWVFFVKKANYKT